MTTLVLGAGGFIGSAVMRQFASGEYGHTIGFVRTDNNARQLSDAGMGTAVGDINDTTSLRSAMKQAATVISCVSYVGNDEQRCIRVNQHGMRHVAAVAAEVGVERLLYVSTAAVYGPGPFRDLPVDGAPLRPQSPASRTRANAEQYVRDAGGLVIRPHLVYGPGDRWFLPTLTRIVSRLGAVIDEGHALLSVVDVSQLARSVCRLSMEQSFQHGATRHVNEPEPMRVIDVLKHHAQDTNWTLPRDSIGRSDALRHAATLGLSMHQVNTISVDHWFKSSLY